MPRYIDIDKIFIPKGLFDEGFNVPKLIKWLESQDFVDIPTVPAEEKQGEWVYWGGWCGNHDKRIEDATCSNCGYRHPTVKGSPELLGDYCPCCKSKMKKE